MAAAIFIIALSANITTGLFIKRFLTMVRTEVMRFPHIHGATRRFFLKNQLMANRINNHANILLASDNKATLSLDH